jgi:hypothetical protein
MGPDTLNGSAEAEPSGSDSGTAGVISVGMNAGAGECGGGAGGGRVGASAVSNTFSRVSMRVTKSFGLCIVA